MSIKVKQLLAALCVSGVVAAPAFAANSANVSETKALKMELASLKKEMIALKSRVEANHEEYVPVAPAKTKHGHRKHRSAARVVPVAQSTNAGNGYSNPNNFMPFDPDVPGQAFVSTGPYVGIPLQYAGSNLIINSPSVNTDVQLLNIRKSILKNLSQREGFVYDATHSHLLLSGVVEGQASYMNAGGSPSQTDINLTNVSLDAFFIGPSDWTLGFVELTYDGNPPISNSGQYNSNSNYRAANSRVSVNKAFITIGNFQKSPFYGSVGQFYVPFGTYSSVMVSDPLTKLLARTKARAILLGFQQQEDNAFYGAGYIFKGDSHAASVSKVNNGGINLGYKFTVNNTFKGNFGGGVIANLADSGGMQYSTFNANEQIVHRVPAYNVRGLFSIGEHVDLIAEYVSASSRFNMNDMSFNGHGAKPWAVDMEAVYSFPILDNKPSSIGIGYAATGQALALGLPLNRTSIVFNTSIWRNTLQSLELHHDRQYAVGNTGTSNSGNTVSTANTGKGDNVAVAQFDYYF